MNATSRNRRRAESAVQAQCSPKETSGAGSIPRSLLSACIARPPRPPRHYPQEAADHGLHRDQRIHPLRRNCLWVSIR